MIQALMLTPENLKSAKKELVRQRFVEACRAHGIPAPVFELHFHATREWRFDYAWPQFRVALEVEGGVFKKGGSRHSRGAGFRKDLEKYNEAAACGWVVLRVLPEQLCRTPTADWIRRTMAIRRAGAA